MLCPRCNEGNIYRKGVTPSKFIEYACSHCEGIWFGKVELEPLSDLAGLAAWCPLCEQGEVQTVRVNQSGILIYVCNECESTWLNKKEISSESCADFETYMQSVGIKPVLAEITILPR